MTDTLTRAANAASEALGMSVEYPRFGCVEIYPTGSKPGTLPEVAFSTGSDGVALAYLEGLECGARIVRERVLELAPSPDAHPGWPDDQQHGWRAALAAYKHALNEGR